MRLIRKGGPKMKESQIYPRQYGQQVFKIHTEHVVP